MKRILILAAVIVALLCPVLVPHTAYATALSGARDTAMRTGATINVGVAVANTIYQGGQTCMQTTGYVAPCGTATDSVALGRAEAGADNSSGANGAISVKVAVGVFQWANDVGIANALTDAHIGQDCYVLDDATVTLTSNSGARVIAGRVVDVDSTGVWVDSRFALAAAGLDGRFLLEGSVGSTEIEDGSLATADYAPGSVTNTIAADGIVNTPAKVAPGVIGLTHLDTGLAPGGTFYVAVVCGTTDAEDDSDASVSITQALINSGDTPVVFVYNGVGIIALINATPADGGATLTLDKNGGPGTKADYCFFRVAS